jgi:hypothetical protein
MSVFFCQAVCAKGMVPFMKVKEFYLPKERTCITIFGDGIRRISASKREEITGENYIMLSYIICSFHKIF